MRFDEELVLSLAGNDTSPAECRLLVMGDNRGRPLMVTGVKVSSGNEERVNSITTFGFLQLHLAIHCMITHVDGRI